MALMLKMLNVTSHADPYLHVHHPRCLLCMSTDVILAGWQETFRSTTSRLAADLKVSCQPAGRRHFLKENHLYSSQSRLIHWLVLRLIYWNVPNLTVVIAM